MKRFEVFRVRGEKSSADPQGALDWTWKLIAANGEFLCGPAQNFSTRAGMMKNLRLVRETDADTPVVEAPWVDPEVVSEAVEIAAPSAAQPEVAVAAPAA